MPNTGGYFLETITNTCNSPKPQPVTNLLLNPKPSTPKFLTKTNATNIKDITEVNSEIPDVIEIQNKTEEKTSNVTETEVAPIANTALQMDVDNEELEAGKINEMNEKDNKLDVPGQQVDNYEDNEDDNDDDDGDYFDERLVVDYDRNMALQNGSPLPEGVDIDIDPDDVVVSVTQHVDSTLQKQTHLTLQIPKFDINANTSGEEAQGDSVKPLTTDEINENASTPIKTTNLNERNESTTDGTVLTKELAKDFHNPNNISPILNIAPEIDRMTENIRATPTLQTPDFDVVVTTNAATENVPPAPMETDADPVDLNAVDDDLAEEFGDLNDLKRKRESFDSISLMSVESFALPNSTKKPKLLRTGSITRSIRRSMSFVAVRTPISKMLRPRRSSVALDGAPNDEDGCTADESFCSIASIESTFNESIRKPVKEKFRSLRNRITRSSSKKDKHNTQSTTPEKDEAKCERELPSSGFKTPKAPAKFLSAAARAIGTPKSLTKHALLLAPTPSPSSTVAHKHIEDSAVASPYIQSATTSKPRSSLPAPTKQLQIEAVVMLQQNVQSPAACVAHNQSASKQKTALCKRDHLQNDVLGPSTMVHSKHFPFAIYISFPYFHWQKNKKWENCIQNK